ncbi:MAG: hypothetical protein L0Y71_23635 [Gemmataceae bacterium]|nr:hypothetical protein [Gemmataceae bacterium]
MFRVTIHDTPEALTYQLEGKLAGAWVHEAEACWRQTLAAQPRPLQRFDLTGLTMIDPAGKAFLSTAHAQGVQMVACGCLMRAIVAEITKSGLSDGPCRKRDRENDILLRSPTSCDQKGRSP